MSNNESRHEGTVTIRQAIEALDSHLNTVDPAHHYDSAAGWSRLQRTIADRDRDHDNRNTDTAAQQEIVAGILTSDLTPESAFQNDICRHDGWQLSWLPTRWLTYEQALAGMQLDELLSDPEIPFPSVHSRADVYASMLGLTVGEAVETLFQRIASRKTPVSKRGEDEELLIRASALREMAERGV